MTIEPNAQREDAALMAAITNYELANRGLDGRLEVSHQPSDGYGATIITTNGSPLIVRVGPAGGYVLDPTGLAETVELTWNTSWPTSRRATIAEVHEIAIEIADTLEPHLGLEG